MPKSMKYKDSKDFAKRVPAPAFLLPPGHIRIRNLIRVNGNDKFSANSEVDVIEPDGTVIENIDSGIYTAARIRLRGL